MKMIPNDGNLTLTGIIVSDELTNAEWQIASLAPGASQTFTTSYTVTDADAKAGSVLNVATAKGTSPDPEKPDVPVEPGTKEDPTVGHLTITKTTTSTPANGSTYGVGETITYNVTATNDGKKVLSNVTVKDELTGDTWTIATLAVGASQSFTATYTVTDADVKAGSVLNVATATADDPEGNDPEVVPGTKEDPTNGHMTVIKTVTSTPANGTAYALGETISYSITVTNDGKVALTNITVLMDITVSDELTEEEWSVETLAPGESAVFTTSYTITQEDVYAGSVMNVASAQGRNDEPSNPDVEEGEAEVPTLDVYIDLTVLKAWANGENALGYRPASLQVMLVSDQATRLVTLTAENGWTATISVPGMANDEEIVYTWMEPAIENYTLTTTAVNGNVTTLVNTLTLPEEEGDRTDYDLTIYYRYPDGSTAAPTYTATNTEGGSYEVPSPEISGYVPSIAVVSGTQPGRDVEYVVIYVPASEEITIEDYGTPLGLGNAYVNTGVCQD